MPRPSCVAIAVASFAVRFVKLGTCTSRVRKATRIDAAAKSTYVVRRAPANRTSFPALQTRVLSAMKTVIVLQLTADPKVWTMTARTPRQRMPRADGDAAACGGGRA